jgi:hypothetical protein
MDRRRPGGIQLLHGSFSDSRVERFSSIRHLSSRCSGVRGRGHWGFHERLAAKMIAMHDQVIGAGVL